MMPVDGAGAGVSKMMPVDGAHCDKHHQPMTRSRVFKLTAVNPSQ
jgi:hypothetical protein